MQQAAGNYGGPGRAAAKCDSSLRVSSAYPYPGGRPGYAPSATWLAQA